MNISIFEKCGEIFYFKNLDEELDKSQWNYDKCEDLTTKGLIDTWMPKTLTKSKYTMWIEMRKRLKLSMFERQGRSNSEQSSQGRGCSSEPNISSSSLPSIPDSSEVACNDACYKHGEDRHDLRSCDKFIHSNSSISLLKENGGGLTLMQMLEVFEKKREECLDILNT